MIDRSSESRADSAPESAQRVVKAVALVILSALTATGFAVSFTRLHGFMGQFGEEGWTAYASAGMVDSLALSGLLVALVFRDWWARAAFVLALGFTGLANAFVGFQYASWFGLAVGLVPIVSMELAYRVALTLVLQTRAGGVVTTPAESDQATPTPDQSRVVTPVEPDQAGAPQVVTAPDHPELPMVAPGPGPDPSMAKAERLDQVRALLDDQPDLTAQQVADHLGVSLTTGRRYSRQVRAERVATAPA